MKKDAIEVDDREVSKSNSSETPNDKTVLQPSTNPGLVSKNPSEKLKDETRRSGCEPIKPSLSKVSNGDTVLIPITSVSSNRSNPSANKSSGTSLHTENSSSIHKPEFIANNDGIGGIVNLKKLDESYSYNYY